MKITKLTNKDFDKAAKLYQEHYPCALAFITKYMKLEGIHLVVKEKDKIIGMIVAPYSNMNPNLVEISFLAVDKEQRGKGTGTKLLKELEQRAKKQNKRSIITYSRSAIEFYQKRGFKKAGSDSGGTLLFKRISQE